MGDKMVLYKLIEENSNEVKYEYYPEGKLDKKGISFVKYTLDS